MVIGEKLIKTVFLVNPVYIAYIHVHITQPSILFQSRKCFTLVNLQMYMTE